jgi:glutaredoxin
MPLKNKIILLLLLILDCKQTDIPTDSSGSSKRDILPCSSIKEGRGLLFTFFDQRAELRTVDSVNHVIAEARAFVMVTDPARPLAHDLVVVADLRSPDRSGGYRSWVEPKNRWLDRVMPKLSLLSGVTQTPPKPTPPLAPGQKKKRRHRPQHSNRTSNRTSLTAPSLSVNDPVKEPVKEPSVLLFSTTWCPSCRVARSYFQGRRIPFLELDVEKDPEAHERYLTLQKRFNLRPGVVPLIVIHGRAFQGFNKNQVEAALSKVRP